MTRYSIKIICLTLVLTLTAYALVACLHREYYFSALGCLLVQLGLIANIIRTQRHFLTSAHNTLERIRMGDMSDRTTTRSGDISAALAHELDKTFDTYKQRLQSEAIRQHYYEQILDEVDTGVLVCKQDGEITWQNRASISLLGTLRDVPLSWISGTSAQKVTYNNHNRMYEMLVCSRRFIVNKQDLRIVSLRDIHEVLEEQEIEAWQKLVSVLTHEIMNSLTPIIGLSEPKENEYPTPTITEADKALSVIHRRSKGLLDFVNNYRQLTRIPKPQCESIPVEEYCSDLQELYGNRLHYTIVPSNLEVYADPRLLMQVLVNLVKNASESGSDTIEINSTRQANGYVEISVRDHGQGILPEVIDSIFVPFFTTKSQGSGIGLSLCKQIIKKHGGRIHVKSSPNHGSVFTINLPPSASPV